MHICLTAADPAHSIPHPLITYQHYLKDRYRTEYPDTQSNSSLSTVPSRFQLVLVRRKNNECDKIQRECLLYQLHGNIDLSNRNNSFTIMITVLAIGATAQLY